MFYQVIYYSFTAEAAFRHSYDFDLCGPNPQCTQLVLGDKAVLSDV